MKTTLALLLALTGSLLALSQDALAYNCGPNALTYTVGTSDPGNQGIRCVRFGGGLTNHSLPVITWYGEGYSGGYAYRHVGHAFYVNGGTMKGYASDLFGSGEHWHGSFPGNLTLEFSGIVNAPWIKVKGAWSETWTLQASNVDVPYLPLAQPSTCGSYFDEYKVQQASGGNWGVRCVLRVGPPGYLPSSNIAWLGSGEWNGTPYVHLGSRGAAGYGASDLCNPNWGTFCGKVGDGGLKISPISGGNYQVSGSWSETWIH